MLDLYLRHPAFLPDVLVDHRSLLFMLPIVLLSTSLLVFWIYRDRIGEKHAQDYRATILFSMIISVLSLLVIGFESI